MFDKKARITLRPSQTQEYRHIPSKNSKPKIKNSRHEENSSLFANIQKAFSQTRDIILGGSGLVYLFGYIAWTYHSYRNNLGLLPVIQSQYIVAGILPVIIIIFVIGISRGLQIFCWALGKSLMQDLTKQRIIERRIALGVYGILVTGILIAVIINSTVPPLKSVSFYVAFALMAIAMPVTPLAKWIFDWKLPKTLRYSFMEWYLTACFPIIVGWGCIYIYLNFVFPVLSQELGGALPHVATFDVVKSDLSKEALNELVAPAAARSNYPIIRTNKVYVFYSNDQKVLIKKYPAMSSETYEIKSGSIKAVTWYDRGWALRSSKPTKKTP